MNQFIRDTVYQIVVDNFIGNRESLMVTYDEDKSKASDVHIVTIIYNNHNFEITNRYLLQDGANGNLFSFIIDSDELTDDLLLELSNVVVKLNSYHLMINFLSTIQEDYFSDDFFNTESYFKINSVGIVNKTENSNLLCMSMSSFNLLKDKLYQFNIGIGRKNITFNDFMVTVIANVNPNNQLTVDKVSIVSGNNLTFVLDKKEISNDFLKKIFK